MQELVYLANGKPVTDSLVVAKVFGKNHKDVLRDIRMLECSEEFRERNFALSSYKSVQNKELSKFIITKDGFTILAMGYTGKQAMQFKERYIQEFNRMSEMLQNKRETLKLPPKNQRQDKSGIFQFDVRREWEWKPNSTYFSEVLDFPAKRTLLRAIGDIGAIEHEQMTRLFKVEQKHVHSMISRGEIIQHELLAERQRYNVYTLGLRGSERIGQPPTRIENWSISDVIEKLVFFEFVRYLENGASSSKLKIEAASSPFVGSIVYPNEECKVLVLQRTMTSFEVPEDDGSKVYALYPKEEYLRALHGQFGWLQEFPYSTFMAVETFRRIGLVAISRNDSDPFEFLNYLP